MAILPERSFKSQPPRELAQRGAEATERRPRDPRADLADARLAVGDARAAVA
jgi:hypothetical protein